MKLYGTWSQPGRDKIVFATKDASIIWRKNKNILFIEGAKASQLKKEVCKYICGDSSETADTLTEIGDLKHGQLLNRDAIQTLSDKLEDISTALSQVRDFMGKKNDSILEKISDQPAEHINLHAGHADDAYVCDANDADVDKSIDTEQLAGIVRDHGDYSLLSNGTICRYDMESISNNQQCEQDKLHFANLSAIDVSGQVDSMGNNDNTYAKVTARPLPIKTIQHSVVPNEDTIISNKGDISGEPIMINNAEIANHGSVTQKLSQQDNGSSDGFVGVQRKSQKIKKFFLSGIAENVKAQDILSYLEKRNVKSTYLTLFRSKRKGSISAKLHVPANLCLLIENETFWPRFVHCKRWQTKPSDRQISATQKRTPPATV